MIKDITLMGLYDEFPNEYIYVLTVNGHNQGFNKLSLGHKLNVYECIKKFKDLCANNIINSSFGDTISENEANQLKVIDKEYITNDSSTGNEIESKPTYYFYYAQILNGWACTAMATVVATGQIEAYKIFKETMDIQGREDISRDFANINWVQSFECNTDKAQYISHVYYQE